MVTTSSTKKVTLKTYQQNENDKEAAQRKVAATKGANGGADTNTASSMVPTPDQVQAFVPPIVIAETTDTFMEQIKQVDDATRDIQAGVFLQVPTAEADYSQFVFEADGVLEAPAEEFSGIRYIVPSMIDMAIQQVVLIHKHPQVLYHHLNDHARHTIEAFMIEKMDDARSMLHRKARMSRIEEQRGYNIPVGRAAEYEDVVGMPEVSRDWMLQPVEVLIESVNLLPDLATDTSGTSSPVIYTPASTSPMNVVFPGDILATHVSDEGHVKFPAQLPVITDRRVPIPKSILAKVARQNRVGFSMSPTSSPRTGSDRRVPIPKSILEKVARQNRVGSATSPISSSRTGSSGKLSQSSSPVKVSYAAALSGGSPNGPKKALGLPAYIPKALEKVFGKGRSE